MERTLRRGRRRRWLPARFLPGAGLLLCAAGPAAAQITTNTALPVTEGHGVLRLQAKYLRSSEDPGPLERELRVWVAPVVGAYGATSKLTLIAVVPVFDKSFRSTAPTGRETREATGLGDVSLLARYTLVQRDRPGQTLRVAPFAGVEVPTGDDDDEDARGRLPQPLQLGSGSWDPLVGLVATRQTLASEFDVSVSYGFNTEANRFRFGDEARADIAYKVRVAPRTLGEGVPAFLFAAAESNLIWQDRNRMSGEVDRDSGGTAWYVAPGLQYVTVRTIIESAVQLPIVQELGGNGLETDLIVTLGVRLNL